MKESTIKPIAGYEGLYQVSDDGKIINRKGKELKPYVDIYGYALVALSKHNKRKTSRVHRLVAQAFIPNPEHKPEVNHKDGNKLNNRVENLEWTTKKENVCHAEETGLVPHPVGEDLSYSKLTEAKVIEMRKLRNEGIPYDEIAMRYGVSNHTTRCACKGFTWSHVNYPIVAYRRYKRN